MRTISYLLTGLLCLLTVSIVSCQSTQSVESTMPAEPPEVLVVTGGHGFDKKQFRKAFSKCTDMKLDIVQHEEFAGMLENGSVVECDAVVLYNFKTRLTDAQRAAFLNMLDQGTGLIALHHGVAAYPEWQEYPEIIGCKYFLKPQEWKGTKHERCKWKHDVEMQVHIAAEDHPVTEGLQDFTLTDESYYGQCFDPDATVLLTTTAETSDEPLAQARNFNGSRVSYIQLGHGAHAFNDPNYQQLLAQAIRWVSESK